MNILKFALEMELDGINYYEELKRKSINSDLNNIFDILIKNEQEHYDICMKMLESDSKVRFSNSTILSECSNVFNHLKKNKVELDIDGITDLLNHAMSIERSSALLYENLADNANDENERKIYEKIVGEERKHYFILESISNYFNGNSDSEITNNEFSGWNVDGMY